MNIKGQGHSVTLVQSHSDSFLQTFFLETAKPIEARIHVEPSRDGGTKIYSNGSGHMTKMAAMSIYNNVKNFFTGTKRPMTLKIGK